MIRLLSMITVLAVTAPAAASPFSEAPDDEPEFNFSWEEATKDGNSEEFDRLMRQGRAALLDAANARTRRSASEHAMKARDFFFDRAAKLRPDDPTPHYYAAEALRAFDGYTFLYKNRIEQTIHHLTEFMRLSPNDSRLPEALFSRSIAYTKLGGEDNIRKALADYDRRLQLHDQLSGDLDKRRTLSLILSNSAELYMYVGDLDRAIALYYDSLDYADIGVNQALYGYGLAVALDRDGQRTRARSVMKNALRLDQPHPLSQLTRETVFFIPNGDIHYYRALGFEALGDARKARTYYLRFLDVLPDSQYADHARENLKALEAEKNKKND